MQKTPNVRQVSISAACMPLVRCFCALQAPEEHNSWRGGYRPQELESYSLTLRRVHFPATKHLKLGHVG